MSKTKERWNVTFRKPDGRWSKPMVYALFANAMRRMNWDDKRGMRMTGTYEIEIRRGATRSGKVISQFRPYPKYNPQRSMYPIYAIKR